MDKLDKIFDTFTSFKKSPITYIIFVGVICSLYLLNTYVKELKDQNIQCEVERKANHDKYEAFLLKVNNGYEDKLNHQQNDK
jgi:hypothetical protein